ncbi:hypothetical protein BYT27DRAFT_7076396, partial [Phlegmacium glaucopus]
KWSDCCDRGYIPLSAKSVEHEPRNGMLLCPNHYIHFNSCACFLRWIPEIHMIVFINFSREPDLEPYHGRAVFLKFQDHHFPFPAIFLLHEARVRARWPFLGDRHLNSPITWQDAFLSHINNDGNLLLAGNIAPPTAPDTLAPSGILPASLLDNGNGSRDRLMDGSTVNVSWNSDQITKVLRSSRQLPTWKACIAEGTSWDGTAEENVEKYRDIMQI